MCSLAALKCPLCAQTNFPNIDALRISLIKAANGPLACPICHELFLGLDKLTIHLFSHTSVMMSAATEAAAAATDTRRPVETEMTKKAAVKSEMKLETQDATSSSSARMKRSNKEKKTKKSRQVVEVAPQRVENVNVSTAFSQQAVVGTNDKSEKGSAATLSTCDICEFTFRDEELRNMHFRLVHQNVSHTSNDHSANAVTSTEPDFKCHLCSKTFKMKGSLRVHLKVVHLMCLPYSGNSPKLSICDRIRHKESKVGTTASKVGPLNVPQSTSLKTDISDEQILPQPPVLTAQQSLQPQQQITLTANSPQVAPQVSNGFTFGALTLLPAPSVAANAMGSLLNLNSNGEFVHAVEGAPLNSNVLLVINTNPAAAAGIDAVTTAIAGGGATAEPQGKTTAESSKMWKCNECAKTFTTKYFLKKHKRLHTVHILFF
ncbi:zinc finger protein 236-like [Rhagoletis pomonella]|uniref:zinc finger protein 236-like n=1 Tax=Rhagoletis pomonella TaxID=28610 RepID=UPI00177F7E46|nr:zinc finger protein 236-like [Rhagoletis pomonella]